MALRRREVYVFPPFRFFPESGELHGKGLVVRCPSQAATVLETLLARAGQVVTREELRARLWPDDDSLAYDDAINKAVSYLRQALRDRSGSPQYIETLPKRGYRFAVQAELLLEGGEVEPLGEPPADPLLQDVSAIAADTQVAHQPSGTFRIQLSRKWRLALACGLLIIVAGSIPLWRSIAKDRATTQAQQRSYLRVGIAPFEADGSDASGLAESFRLDITDALAQVPQLRVGASHVTPANSEGRRAMLALQADVLVFGTLSFKAGRIQLQLELARGSDATHMATFRYDVARKDLIGLREEVQRDLLLALNASRMREGAALGSTDDAEAYATFLQARTHLRQWDPASWNLAANEFRQAIARDPGFARAYSGLATTLITMTEHGVIPQQGYEEARSEVMKALKLDPQLAEGHAVLGNISYSHDWDLVRAEQEYRHAIALDPEHSHYHVWLASLLCTLGRFRESIDEVNLAHALDPSWKSPFLAATSIYHSAGQPGRSLAVARQLVEMEPKSAIAHNQLGWSCWYAGLYPQAVEEWRTMAVLDGDKDRVALEDEGAVLLKKDGMKAYAEMRLKAIESGKVWQQASNDFVPSEWFIYAGQRDNAIAELSSQIDRRDPAALQIAVDPAYASLQQDPRYLMLLRRVHLSLPVLLGRNDWHSVWN